MQEISLIHGDASDIYEFSSKEVQVLDDKWEASWTISDNLGDAPILEGTLIKNENIFNTDSLIDEPLKKSYKIFQSTGNEEVVFNEDIILNDTISISGVISEDGVPQIDKYITITIKGLFVDYSREIRVKSNDLGEFNHIFNLGPTIKTPENSFFIFQLMPLQCELLEIKTYILSIEVRQKNIANEIVFRKEVLTNKLKIKQQGVL